MPQRSQTRQDRGTDAESIGDAAARLLQKLGKRKVSERRQDSEQINESASPMALPDGNDRSRVSSRPASHVPGYRGAHSVFLAANDNHPNSPKYHPAPNTMMQARKKPTPATAHQPRSCMQSLR